MSTAPSFTSPPSPASPVVYPCSDGEPMSDNTRQYEWIVRFKGGVEAHCPDAFVAGNVLWYYVQGDPKQRIGPDVLVAFGRPRGHRGSYLTWEEGGVIPQVILEVWSPGNKWPERARKLTLYDKLGVEEFITYDPEDNEFVVHERNANGALVEIDATNGWVSPRMGIRFQPAETTLDVFGPDGKPLRFYQELVDDARKAEEDRAKAEGEREKAEARAEAMAAKLRALGINPEE